MTPAPRKPHTGSFIIDPDDNRRDPFELVNFFFHQWRESPFHQESLMRTCHDVSNPCSKSSRPTPSSSVTSTRPTRRRNQDMFPVERTYSEWAASVYAQDAIETGGRFGGDKTAVSSYQTATCRTPWEPGAIRTSTRPCVRTFRALVRRRELLGLRAIRSQYDDADTGLTQQSVDDLPWLRTRQCWRRPRASRRWWTAETSAFASPT